MSTMVETNTLYTRDSAGGYAAADRETDASLTTKDTIGGVVAAIMTLGPLVATAWFGI